MTKKQFLINGIKVRDYRILLDMTQQDLSDLTDISVSTLSKIENGKHEIVRTDNLFKISMALECQPGDLVKYGIKGRSNSLSNNNNI